MIEVRSAVFIVTVRLGTDVLSRQQYHEKMRVITYTLYPLPSHSRAVFSPATSSCSLRILSELL